MAPDMLLCDEGRREAMTGTAWLYDVAGERPYRIDLPAPPDQGKEPFIARHTDKQALYSCRAAGYIADAANRTYPRDATPSDAAARVHYRPEKLDAAITCFDNHKHQMHSLPARAQTPPVDCLRSPSGDLQDAHQVAPRSIADALPRQEYGGFIVFTFTHAARWVRATATGQDRSARIVHNRRGVNFSLRTRRHRTPSVLRLFTVLAASLTLALGWADIARASVPCGPVRAAETAFYDYADKSATNSWHLRDVYQAHFQHILVELKSSKPDILNLFRQLKYILHRIPNHYPTLEMYGRLYKKYPKIRAQIRSDENLNRYRPITPECVFDRAFRFHPDDPRLRLLYGLFFHRNGDLKHALEQYQIAAKMRPNWAEVQYNMGLIYLNQKDYANARVHAKKAYDLGYPLPALRNKLKTAGAWP